MQNCYSALCELVGMPEERSAILAQELVANITNTIDKLPKKNKQKLKLKHPVEIEQVKKGMTGPYYAKRVTMYTRLIAAISGTAKTESAVIELRDVMKENQKKIGDIRPKPTQNCCHKTNQGPGQ